MAIVTGKYPAGGMKDVQGAVVKELERLGRLLRSIDENTEIGELKLLYEQFAEALVVGFYAFMIQGRIDAILMLTVTIIILLYIHIATLL